MKLSVVSVKTKEFFVEISQGRVIPFKLQVLDKLIAAYPSFRSYFSGSRKS